MCESRAGCPGFPIPNKPDGFWGCKATLKWTAFIDHWRSAYWSIPHQSITDDQLIDPFPISQSLTISLLIHSPSVNHWRSAYWSIPHQSITDDQLIDPFPISQSQLETDSWKLLNIQNWSQKQKKKKSLLLTSIIIIRLFHRFSLKWQSKQWVTSLPSSSVNIRMENSFSKVHAFQSLFHDIIWKQIFKCIENSLHGQKAKQI